MSRRALGSLVAATAVVLASLVWSLPAGSQTDCSLNEAYTNPTGGTSPIITDTTPFISFTVTNPSLVAFPVDPANAVFCDANGQDRNPTTGQIQSWQVPAGTPLADLRHQAAPGFFVQGIVVRARVAPTTTSSSSTSSTAPTSSTSTLVPTSTTTTTSTSSTTTTSTSTSTTTTTTPPPPGPGIGPVNVRPDTLARTSPDAAAVRGFTRLDVVVGGPDNNVYWSWQDRSPWSAYFNLGGPPSGGIVGNPTITSWGPGRLDVFARGSDNKLWQTYSENGGVTWIGWLRTFDDGVLASGPGVSSRGEGRLNVFVVGTDGNIWERHYDGPVFGWNSQWLPHGAPSANISGDPAPVSWQGGDDRVDVFVRGGDNKLWQSYYDGTGWINWLRPVGEDGNLTSEPEAMSWEPGNIVIFAKGTDNGVYALPYGAGGWPSWVRLVKNTDTWQSGPGATSRGAGSFDLFVRGTDNIVYYIWQ